MSNPANIVQFEGAKVPSLQMNETELMGVLRNSLYPGAKDESIKLVIGYCKAAGLDPLMKPVHIVPMDVKVGKKANGSDLYEKRDVIMPGVGSYRSQAARSGAYAGMSEPEFGPVKSMATKTKQWNNAHENDKSFTMVDGPEISYPEWCKITVRRVLGNGVVEFTAIEYWLENYATAGKDTTAPNAMWKKRPYGQIAKCAEAQALRKAFPEVGAAPTADEMDGKVIDEGDITPLPLRPAIEGVQSKSEKREPQTIDQPADTKPAEKAADNPAEGSSTSKPMADGQKRILRAKLTNATLSDVDVKAKFGRTLDEDGWMFDHFAQVQDWIAERQSNA